MKAVEVCCLGCHPDKALLISIGLVLLVIQDDETMLCIA